MLSHLLRSAAALVVLLIQLPVQASEAEMVLPDVASVSFGDYSGRSLLLAGLLVCAAGIAFGMNIFAKLRALPVHHSMQEISELIYETCKTYLITQGKFILLLEVFIGSVIVFYFGWLRHFDALKV
ncbi:MAG: sodium-translocating pyrophosphatase, partial [Deltaproteobacteria bacterium]